MNARVGIVIPTLNRPDFVIRQLAYYAAAGSGIALYVADSTEGEGFERVGRAVDSLPVSLSVVHLSLPGLNGWTMLRNRTRFYGRGCQEKHVPAERTTVPNTVVAASPCLR